MDDSFVLLEAQGKTVYVNLNHAATIEFIAEEGIFRLHMTVGPPIVIGGPGAVHFFELLKRRTVTIQGEKLPLTKTL